MSVIYNPQSCAESNENLGQNSCLATKMLALSGYFAPGGGKKYTHANLVSESFVQGELAAGRLYKLPKFGSAIALEQSDIQSTTNNYGNIVTTSTKAAMNATMGIEGGTCNFRKLKQWSNREVTIFFTDDTRYAGSIAITGETLELIGITAKLSVRNGIKFKESDTDENIYPIELNIQASDANVDEFVTVGYNPSNKVGVTDVIITEVGSEVDEIEVAVTTACDGLPLTGLVTADFEVLDSNGDAVVVTATEGVDGSYTLVGTIPAATYSVSLDGAIDIGGFLYASGSVAVTVAGS